MIKLNDLPQILQNGGLLIACAQGINLDIEEGELVAIMGSSGSENLLC